MSSPDRNFTKGLLEQLDMMADVLVDMTVALNVLREPIHRRLEAVANPDKMIATKTPRESHQARMHCERHYRGSRDINDRVSATSIMTHIIMLKGHDL